MTREDIDKLKKERDELIESGAEREDISYANQRIMEAENELKMQEENK